MVLPKTRRLHSPAPPAEVARRARALVDPPGRAGPAGARPEETTGSCTGTVGEGVFDLRRITRRGRPGLVRAVGTFAADGTGTAIVIRFRPSAATILLLVAVSFATVAAGVDLAGRPGPLRLVDVVTAVGLGLAFLVTLLQVAWERARLEGLLATLAGERPG